MCHSKKNNYRCHDFPLATEIILFYQSHHGHSHLAHLSVVLSFILPIFFLRHTTVREFYTYNTLVRKKGNLSKNVITNPTFCSEI